MYTLYMHFFATQSFDLVSTCRPPRRVSPYHPSNLIAPHLPVPLPLFPSLQLSAPATQARRRPAGQTPTSSAMDLRDILDVAHSLSPPEDLVFVAREVGLRLRGQATARTQIKELQKKYVHLDRLHLSGGSGSARGEESWERGWSTPHRGAVLAKNSPLSI